MPDSTDNPDFEFPEGFVPGGPEDEEHDDPMGYFDDPEDVADDAFPNDPEAMVPGDLVPDSVIADTPRRPVAEKGKGRSRKPLIIAASVLLAGAVAGGAYWQFSGGNLPSVDPVAQVAPKSTQDLLAAPFDSLAPSERERLLKRAETGGFDEKTYRDFLDWRDRNSATINVNRVLKRRVDECIKWLDRKIQQENSQANDFQVPRMPFRANAVRWKLAMSHRSALSAATLLNPIAALTAVQQSPGETTEPSDQETFENTAEPVRYRLYSAERLIDNETDPQKLVELIDGTLPLLKEMIFNDYAEIREYEKQELETGIDYSADIKLLRVGVDDRSNVEKKYLKRRAELLSNFLTIGEIRAQIKKSGISADAIAAANLPDSASEKSGEAFEGIKENLVTAVADVTAKTDGRPDAEQLSADDDVLVRNNMEFIRQGWFELKLRIQIEASVADLGLPPELPELSDTATAEEQDEFSKASKSVEDAKAALQQLVENHPADTFLTTDDAASAMTQLQIMRTGWTEMKLMKLIVDNRSQIPDTPASESGPTPAQINAVLEGLAVPDPDTIPLPPGADQAAITTFEELRATVKSSQQAILDALQDMEPEMSLPAVVATEVTAKIETLRSSYFQMLARSLSSGGTGGTSYVLVEAGTAAAFRAALDGIGVPEDLSTLKLVRATPDEQDAFDSLATDIDTNRTEFFAELENKEPDEELAADIATKLTANLGAVRRAYFDMRARMLNSQVPPSGALTVGTVRSILKGLGEMDVQLNPKASADLTKSFNTVRTNLETTIIKIEDVLKGLPDDATVSAGNIPEISEQIEIARREFSALQSYAILSGVPAPTASSTSVIVTAVTKPAEVRAVLSGLGLPEVLDTLQLDAAASKLQQDAFEALRKRVSEAKSAIEMSLQEQEEDVVLPGDILTDTTRQIEVLRLSLVEMKARVAVSSVVPASSPSQPPIQTNTRERLLAFLKATGLPARLEQIKPSEQKPSTVSESQFKHQQSVWTDLQSDVDSLSKLSSGAMPESTELSEEEVRDAQTKMDRVLVNLSQLETASQIAALRFPESGEPSSRTTVPAGPTMEQVRQAVYNETQGIRSEIHQAVNNALTQPRPLLPEQLATVAELTTGRVMQILSGEGSPPYTLPPDPTNNSSSGSDRNQAAAQFRLGSVSYFTNGCATNLEALNRFSAAATLDPRNPGYRYFLALSLRRDGRPVEATRQARIGASLEARRDRAVASTQLEHVQGEPRAWLEGLRTGR